MIHIPNFLYGTAWKEDKTSELVVQALRTGFRGFDTANQRKHYFEEAVGIGLREASERYDLKREDLFVQTKYTYSRGQDHRLPYQRTDSFEQQVIASLESSLVNLRTSYVDALILHGPYTDQSLHSIDERVWSTMESLIDTQKVKSIGVSNISLTQLKALYEVAKIEPAIVQNRCFAQQQWDMAIRQYCLDNRIIYQGFSLLTANQHVLNHPKIRALSKHYNKSIAQIIFKFCQQVAILPLTGTTQISHMQDDLCIDDFELSDGELSRIETIHYQ